MVRPLPNFAGRRISGHKISFFLITALCARATIMIAIIMKHLGHKYLLTSVVQ